MEIWLIKGGKKSGPYHDYEIREKIGHKELDGDEVAWHEGLPSWTKLSKIDIFSQEFEASEDPIQPPQLPKEYLDKINAPGQGPEKPKRYLARRFWARWMDLVLYSAVWWLVMYAVGRDIEAAIRNPWLQLSDYVPWFVLEAWLIHRFGSTPGKWLMGLSVRNEDGSILDLKPSIWRSLRVLITGIGFGWGLLMVLCQGMSWFTTKRLGKPIWDHIGGHKIVTVPLKPIKIITLILLFFVAAQLQMAVRGPFEEKIVTDAYPNLKEFFENGNQWYFPVKN